MHIQFFYYITSKLIYSLHLAYDEGSPPLCPFFFVPFVSLWFALINIYIYHSVLRPFFFVSSWFVLIQGGSTLRIGIVNDILLAREALRRVVSAMPGHQVAWTARDGAEAVAMAGRDRPDLILMDLFMPRMDGAEATRRIMAECPCPIVVVTATVSGHLNKVYEAMGNGALDAADTPALGPRGELTGADALREKIQTIGKLIGPDPHLAFGMPAMPARYPMVLLGASTGGPNALAEVLGGLPVNSDACVLIVQHVDQAFAPGLAQWLGERTGHPVELAVEGDRPGPGRRLLAATNDHMVLSADRRLGYVAEPRELSYRPSVDVLFASVAAHWSEPGVAALLTGMGRDGAEGLLQLRRREWHTIAQDEATSVVYGMPKAAAEVGAAVQILPLAKIATAVAARATAGRS
jgi:two-component system, chemotaxis family, response regulator WspF